MAEEGKTLETSTTEPESAAKEETEAKEITKSSGDDQEKQQEISDIRDEISSIAAAIKEKQAGPAEGEHRSIDVEIGAIGREGGRGGGSRRKPSKRLFFIASLAFVGIALLALVVHFVVTEFVLGPSERTLLSKSKPRPTSRRSSKLTMSQRGSSQESATAVTLRGLLADPKSIPSNFAKWKYRRHFVVGVAIACITITAIIVGVVLYLQYSQAPEAPIPPPTNNQQQHIQPAVVPTGLAPGAIGGIVAGVVVFLAIVVVAIAVYVRSRGPLIDPVTPQPTFVILPPEPQIPPYNIVQFNELINFIKTRLRESRTQLGQGTTLAAQNCRDREIFGFPHGMLEETFCIIPGEEMKNVNIRYACRPATFPPGGPDDPPPALLLCKISGRNPWDADWQFDTHMKVQSDVFKLDLNRDPQHLAQGQRAAVWTILYKMYGAEFRNRIGQSQGTLNLIEE